MDDNVLDDNDKNPVESVAAPEKLAADSPLKESEGPALKKIKVLSSLAVPIAAVAADKKSDYNQENNNNNNNGDGDDGEEEEEEDDPTLRLVRLKKPSHKGKRTWDELFQALVDFKNGHGHANPTKRFEGDTRLGSWASEQRRFRDKLKREQIEKLEAIGFDFETVPERDARVWNEWVEELKKFKEKHGHCRVPKSNKRLGKWVRSQRVSYKRNKLPADRMAQLEEVGFEWSLKDIPARNSKQQQQCGFSDEEEWQEHIEVLRNLEHTTETDLNGALDTLCEKFTSREDTRWLEQYRKLVRFRKENGHCRVPSEYHNVDQRLATWVITQRKYFRTDEMLDHRKELLQALDFEFELDKSSIHSTNPQRWEDYFQKLSNFKDSEGHLKLGFRHRKLGVGTWLAKQKQEGREGTLQGRRALRLLELGVTWEEDNNGDDEGNRDDSGTKEQDQTAQESDQTAPFDLEWEKMFFSLKEFFEKNGHWQVTAGNTSLYLWVLSQRESFEQNLLTPYRRNKLNKINFGWNPDAAFGTTLENEDDMNKYPQLLKANNPPAGNENADAARSEAARALVQLDLPLPALDELGEDEIAVGREKRRFEENNESPTDQGKRQRSETLSAAKHKPPLMEAQKNLAKEPVEAEESEGGSQDENKDDKYSRFTSGSWNRRTWDQFYEDLVHYHKIYGNSNCPKGFKDTGLGHWACKQRKRKDQLTEEQRNKLDALGFCWETQKERDERVWDERFSELLVYKEEHGNCRVPKNIKPLGTWVRLQRVNCKNGKLGPERHARLSSIGFEWELKRVASKAGNCDEGSAGCGWDEQVQMIQQLFQSQDGGSFEVDSVLEVIENREVTSKEDKRWLGQYKKLVDFQRMAGHTMVPHHFTSDQSLADWVRTQRRYYRAGKLNPARVGLLNAIGFIWKFDVDQGSKGYVRHDVRIWEEYFTHLQKYVVEKGNPNVDPAYDNQYGLGRWLAQQKETARNGMLDSKLVRRLASVGVEWANHFDLDWEEKFFELRSFHANYGNFFVTMSTAPAELIAWVKTQRELYDVGTIVEERKQRLDSVGFPWKATASRPAEAVSDAVPGEEETKPHGVGLKDAPLASDEEQAQESPGQPVPPKGDKSHVQEGGVSIVKILQKQRRCRRCTKYEGPHSYICPGKVGQNACVYFFPDGNKKPDKEAPPKVSVETV